jgi:hypothetical protein
MPPLTDAQHKIMKQRYDAGEAICKLAEDYHCTEKTVKRHVQRGMRSEMEVTIPSEGKQQSYRQNLNWALEAAGRFIRTKDEPESCPNDAAFFLYTQAVAEPKDFMAKVSTLEKGSEDQSDREEKRSTRKSLAEIEAFLEKLSDEEKQADVVQGAQEEKSKGP